MTSKVEIINHTTWDNYIQNGYATEGSAGLDLMLWNSTEPRSHLSKWTLEPGQTVKFDTGLSIWLKNPNIVMLVFSRSGLATKFGLGMANFVAVIDSDYQGPLIVSIRNSSDVPQQLSIGERIAQAVIMPIKHLSDKRRQYDLTEETNPVMLYEVVSSFSNSTTRGVGGFGSTGK